MPDPLSSLRRHLTDLLVGGGAHITFDDAVASLDYEKIGAKPAHAAHTPWRLVYHIRFTQADLLDYSRNPDYREPRWPSDYWPATDAPPDDFAWDREVEAFRTDLDAFVALLNNPATDLFAPLPWGAPGHTVLRSALLAADHTAYHLGQLIEVRRALQRG